MYVHACICICIFVLFLLHDLLERLEPSGSEELAEDSRKRKTTRTRPQKGLLNHQHASLFVA